MTLTPGTRLSVYEIVSLSGNAGFQELLRDVERRGQELVAWEQTRG